MAPPVELVTIPGHSHLRAVKTTLPPRERIVDPELDFSVKKSPLFGGNTNEAEFEQGTYWYPLQRVSFTFSQQGLSSIQSHYRKKSTKIFGSKGEETGLVIDLEKDEYITGLSGLAAETLTELTIQTSKREVRVGGVDDASGTPFNFKVPDNHAVVAFHGRADKLVTSLGVSYARRLESVAPQREPNSSSDPSLERLSERLHITDELKKAVRNRDDDKVNKIKSKVKSDLKAVYDRILLYKEKAFETTKTKSGEIFYVAQEDESAVVIYTREDADSTKFIVVESYSGNTGLQSVSGYKWSNLDVDVQPEVLSYAATLFLPILYEHGELSPEAAAAEFANCLNDTGDEKAQKAAGKVSSSTKSFGGLFVIPLLMNLLWAILVEIWEYIVCDYIVNVFFTNFDSENEWKVTEWFSYNAVAVDGSDFAPATVPVFEPEGSKSEIPGHEEEEGVHTADAPGRHAYSISNSADGFGLGIAMKVVRGDGQQAFALGYYLPRTSDNQLALKGPIDVDSFNLEEFYHDGSNWVEGQLSTTLDLDGFEIRAKTNALSGVDDGVYLYEIEIGTPPA